MKKKFQLILIPLVLVLVSGSCGSPEGTTFISIGTGGTGGAYYPYGGGLAEIWTKYVTGIKALAEVTAASVENVRLAHKGETVIGEIMGDVAYEAFYGQGKFKNRGPQKIIALAVMYPSILQVVTLRKSGIDTIQQLKTRIVSIGAPGSGTAFMSELVLGALAISLEDIKIRRLSFVENSNTLRDHTIQVGIWCVAPPTSSIMDLATTHNIKVIPFTAVEQGKVCEKYPFYSSYDLAPGVYRGADQAVPTISVWNVIICHSSLPEELIYKLAGVLFENNEYMKQIHPYARFTTMENTVKHSPIPLHPGSIKYLREKGFNIPDKLISR